MDNNETVERVLESRIQLRNDTAANWRTANPILLKGEVGIEIDTRKIKVGDGISTWATLKYITDDVVLSDANPTETDADYDIGELWLNKADGKVFVLIAKNETAAVWARIPTADELVVVAESVVAQKLKTARRITVSGDATGETEFDGSEDTNIVLVLANSGTAAGTFTKFTVNEKGLIIKSELLTPEDIPELTLAKITDAGTAAARNVGSKAGNLVELGANGKIDKKYLPPIAITEPFAVSSEEEMLALTAQKGDVAIRSDESKSYILKNAPASVLENWLELQSPDCKISSVNGQVGAVVLTTADIEEKENLYYTEERAKNSFTENFGQTSSADLTDGETILHATDTIRIVDLLMDKNSGRITEKEYERQMQLLKFHIDELNLKKEVMLNEQGKMQLAEYRADAVTDLLRTGKILDEFDKTIFKSLVRKIKVVGEKKVEIEFECGIKVTENL